MSKPNTQADEWKEQLKETLYHETVYGNPTFDPKGWSKAIDFVDGLIAQVRADERQTLDEQLEKKEEEIATKIENIVKFWKHSEELIDWEGVAFDVENLIEELRTKKHSESQKEWMDIS